MRTQSDWTDSRNAGRRCDFARPREELLIEICCVLVDGDYNNNIDFCLFVCLLFNADDHPEPGERAGVCGQCFLL